MQPVSRWWGSHTDNANEEILVALVGITGSGKSSFIKRATGDEKIEIGHDVNSMTAKVQQYHLTIHNKPFVLVDTPGFDDGEWSDEDVFEELAEWLKRSHNDGRRFNALLYLHRIIANREKGSDLRSLKVFKGLCGSENFDKIMLGITWWDQEHPKIALAREKTLCETPEYWGDMIRCGAFVERISHDKDHCVQLLQKLSHNPKATLRIQDEMAKGKHALHTTAAEEMERYKAIKAIRDEEKIREKEQENVYKLQSQNIEQRASEQRDELARRFQELEEQQTLRISSLKSTVMRLQEQSRVDESSATARILDLERKVLVLEQGLQQAQNRQQRPTPTVSNQGEGTRIVSRTTMHRDEIAAEFDRLKKIGDASKAKQPWRSIRDPCVERQDFLWGHFCDRCLKQASATGYWLCHECQFSAGLMLLCNHCKAQGHTCLNSSHTLTQYLPQYKGWTNNTIISGEAGHPCARLRCIPNTIQCRKCKAPPSPLFLHCCHCHDDEFDLCLKCFGAGKTCKEKKKHTLLLLSWCPAGEWSHYDRTALD